MNNKPCPICGSNLTEQSWGKNKYGKPYHAFRHEDPQTECVDVATGKPFIEWINEPRKPIAQRRAEADNEQYANLVIQHKELRNLLYVILWKLGMTNRDIQDDLDAIKEGRK